MVPAFKGFGVEFIATVDHVQLHGLAEVLVDLVQAGRQAGLDGVRGAMEQ